MNNSCKDFDNNNACKFIKSSCITGAAGGQSGCWQASETWDCGQDVTVPSTTQTETYQCAGAVQCINGTCLTPESEPSGDFQTAVAMLQAATYAVNEMTCGDETINVNRTCT
ncbi:conjugal transfer protein TraN, partial [Proteus mirabilis]|uniref:conjugal transfer protein TraN n=1 Tax=Proteus mirabilis TaxID=584 RepID=UPI00217E9C08